MSPTSCSRVSTNINFGIVNVIYSRGKPVFEHPHLRHICVQNFLCRGHLTQHDWHAKKNVHSWCQSRSTEWPSYDGLRCGHDTKDPAKLSNRHTEECLCILVRKRLRKAACSLGAAAVFCVVRLLLSAAVHRTKFNILLFATARTAVDITRKVITTVISTGQGKRRGVAIQPPPRHLSAKCGSQGRGLLIRACTLKSFARHLGAFCRSWR